MRCRRDICLCTLTLCRSRCLLSDGLSAGVSAEDIKDIVFSKFYFYDIAITTK